MKLSRNNLTPEELHSELEEKVDRENGVKRFTAIRQYNIGKYYADFYYPDFNIVLEVDGKKFHSQSIDFSHDRKRDQFMNENGYTVVRVSGSMIHKNVEGVLQCLPMIGCRKLYFINADDDLRAIQMDALFREGNK